MPTFRISLRQLRFHSRIGVGLQERRVGNDFTVSVEVTVDASGFRCEDIAGTISYADIYALVAAEMKREWQLLESVALSIAEALRREWPQISGGKVEIVKESVPIAGIDGTCGVEYRF